MPIFNFTATKAYYICNVAGNTITIRNSEATPIDVGIISDYELNILAKGVYFQDLITNNNAGFQSYYENIIGSINDTASVPTERIQDTVAEMFDSGTLITSDYDDDTGKIQLTPLPGILIKSYVSDTSGAVHVDGGHLSITSGINFQIEAGSGYAKDPDGNILEVEWGNLNGACLHNGNNYIGITYDGQVEVSSSQLGPDIIPIGYINTAAGNTVVSGISNIHANGENANYWVNQWVRNAVGVNVEFGCNVSALPSPNDLSIVVTSGRVWAQFNQIDLPDIYNFTKIFGSSVGFIPNTSNPNVIDVNYINNRANSPGTALVPMTAGYYKKDLIFTTAEGNVYSLYATEEYATPEEAIAAPLPLAPSSISSQIIRLAGIVTQQGGTSIYQILDTRPNFAKVFEKGIASTPTTAISHNDLTDLEVDSHTQYHTDARGDIRYYPRATVDSLLANKSNTSHIHSNATISTDGFMSSSDKTKLDSVASGATQNSSDAALLNRANHTGTQDASTITGLTKSSVGLSNVDNTSDIDKPVSTATQAALDTKANTSHTHTISDTTGLQAALDSKQANLGTSTASTYLRGDLSWQTLNKSAVGLSNVDNTSDANKPISTATQTALNSKSDIGHTHTISNVTGLQTALDGKESTIATGTTSQFYRGDKTFAAVTKSNVGLGNVQDVDTTTTVNITDSANKRFVTDANLTALTNISGTNTGDETLASIKSKLGFATTAADGYLKATDFVTFNNKEPAITAGTTGQYYRGDKTFQPLNKSAVGLGNVDDTSDANKPISTATQTAINTKLNAPTANGIAVHTGSSSSTGRSLLGTTGRISITNADGVAGNPVFDIPANPVFTGTDSITISSGTTAQRGSVTTGKLRFNTTLDQYEGVRQGVFAPLGKVVQLSTGTIAVQSGTARQFFDNFVPDVAGGFSIVSTTFTPIFTNSNIVLEFSIMCDSSSNNRTIVTIVTVNGVLSGVTAANSYTAGRPANQSLQIVIPSQGAGVPLNIDIRSGANGGGTTYINRGAGASMGNTGTTTWTMTEYV